MIFLIFRHSNLWLAVDTTLNQRYFANRIRTTSRTGVWFVVPWGCIAIMTDETTNVAALKAVVRQFAAERNWDPYHSPKNLVMALACEVGELVEPFRWLSEWEARFAVFSDANLREAVADEMADVLNLLLQISIHTGIDLSDAMQKKMVKNAVKYPI